MTEPETDHPEEVLEQLQALAEAGDSDAQYDPGFIIRLALTAARGTGYNGSLYRSQLDGRSKEDADGVLPQPRWGL